jgi:hypothetical protein
MKDYEKEIYVLVSKNLINAETIEFDVMAGCAYLLKHGCKKMNMPPMTLVIYKPRLIHSSQEQVQRAIEKRTDINKVFLIYGTLYETDNFKVHPDKNIGKMETLSYLEFERLASNMGKEITIDKLGTSVGDIPCRVIEVNRKGDIPVGYYVTYDGAMEDFGFEEGDKVDDLFFYYADYDDFYKMDDKTFAKMVIDQAYGGELDDDDDDDDDDDAEKAVPMEGVFIVMNSTATTPEITGVYPTLRSALDNMIYHCDFYKPHGTGRIYYLKWGKTSMRMQLVRDLTAEFESDPVAVKEAAKGCYTYRPK